MFAPSFKSHQTQRRDQNQSNIGDEAFEKIVNW